MSNRVRFLVFLAVSIRKTSSPKFGGTLNQRERLAEESQDEHEARSCWQVCKMLECSRAIDDSMFKTDSDTNEVRAFDKELRQIAQIFEHDITEISLMEATTFSL